MWCGSDRNVGPFQHLIKWGPTEHTHFPEFSFHSHTHTDIIIQLEIGCHTQPLHTHTMLSILELQCNIDFFCSYHYQIDC